MLGTAHLVELVGAWRLGDELRATPVAHEGTTSYVWRLESSSGIYAAKLMLDQPQFVEPGLRVALAVAEAGVPTGEPMATPDGTLTVPVSTADGRTATLAVLRWCEGKPLDAASPEAGRRTGDLLGRVHATLLAVEPQPEVPGHLLSWFAGFLSARNRAEARPALGAAKRLVAQDALTMGILYGDPSPEILLGDDGDMALIDWGTPSYGPLLHDVAVWTEVFAPNDEARAAFWASYAAHQTLRGGELEQIGPFVTLARALSGA